MCGGTKTGWMWETCTVDIHIAKLRRKIEPDPERAQSALTLRGEGYRLGCSTPARGRNQGVSKQAPPVAAIGHRVCGGAVDAGLFLAWTAYTQPGWQTFHQYGQLAQSFTQEVDVLLQAFAGKRKPTKSRISAFGREPPARPLAELPESGDNPPIGYFQINEAGGFHPPPAAT